MSKVSWPSFWHLHPGVRQREELSVGERAADRMRNIMGSWPFVFSFFAVMILWAATNTYFLQRVIHHKAFDPYPYILLNLFLSMLAGVQAAALLIAAKRTDSIASEIALHTVKNTDDIRRPVGREHEPDQGSEEGHRSARRDPSPRRGVEPGCRPVPTRRFTPSS